MGSSTYLVTTIADSPVTHVTARSAKSDCQDVEDSVLRSGLECMAWVMTVLQPDVTWYAEIIVLAYSARDEVGFLEDYRC